MAEERRPIVQAAYDNSWACEAVPLAVGDPDLVGRITLLRRLWTNASDQAGYPHCEVCHRAMLASLDKPLRYTCPDGHRFYEPVPPVSWLDRLWAHAEGLAPAARLGRRVAVQRVRAKFTGPAGIHTLRPLS
jgi:hypothetical protein